MDYATYMKSTAWRRAKRRYRESDLPQDCVVCGSSRVEYHHRTYARLGCERLTDLVPLCRRHHVETHKRIEKGARLWDAHEAIEREQVSTLTEYAGMTRAGGWKVTRVKAEKRPRTSMERHRHAKKRKRRGDRQRELVKQQLPQWEAES